MTDIIRPAHPPILISGCPRSGTTFCGQIVSASPSVFEVYEPFNHDFNYNLDLPAKFFRITPANEAPFIDRFNRMMRLASLHERIKMLPRGGIDRILPKRDMTSALSLKKLVEESASFTSANRLSIKDPIAFYSAEWLAKAYDARVVMMVRHPGGVVSSFLSLGWEAETKYIVDHPLPLSQGKFDDEIAAWRKNPDDKVGAAILQWKLFTQATLDLHKLYPDWFFALHDQLCVEPVAVFKKMFKAIDLPFTPDIEARIKADTGASNVVDPTKHTQHNLQRESASLKDSWKKRLDAPVIDRILEETSDLWTAAEAAFTLPANDTDEEFDERAAG